ncbi:amidohydrolase [filamentous cyanobacterium CCP5]|nr:amidohydrolase [filamentous cyanobacterium CCP5]
MALEQYDLVLTGGRVIDPSQSLDGYYDVAIQGNTIAAIAPQLPPHNAQQTLSVEGQMICPGLIDLHVHVYEWVTDFGLWADDVGVQAGVTTVVDQGSCGPLTFLGFKANIVSHSQTDVRCFPSVNLAGALKGGMGAPVLHSPEMVDLEALAQMAAEHPDIVRGFKVHGESGALSRWGTQVIELARQAADAAGLPLYVHTGELFAVVEANRPSPEQVIDYVLPHLRPGDLLAHCYSCRPDGLLGDRPTPSPALIEAVEAGVRLDLGHGINFSFAIARRMMASGLLPFTISSDVHGDFAIPHNDATLDYSLCGALSKLVALGMDLETAIAAVTYHPAQVLQAETDIGTLKVGSRADITVLEQIDGPWTCRDATGETLMAPQRFSPAWVVRAGALVQPSRRLVRDLAVV